MIDKLRSVGDRARGMRGAATGRAQDGLLAERGRARLASRDATHKLGGIRALELALEQPVELCVPWRLLAVWHAERVGLAFKKKHHVE